VWQGVGMEQEDVAPVDRLAMLWLVLKAHRLLHHLDVAPVDRLTMVCGRASGWSRRMGRRSRGRHSLYIYIHMYVCMYIHICVHMYMYDNNVRNIHKYIQAGAQHPALPRRPPRS